MLLADFVADVYLPSRVSVSPGWARNIFAVILRFSRGLGRDAKMADLNAKQIANYLTAYAELWSATSTNSQRQILLMLWDATYRHRLLDRQPEPELIRKLPVEVDPPTAWTFRQVQSLLAEADRQRGEVGGVPASLFWVSLFSTTYWTA